MQSERAGTGIGMTSAACLWLGLFPLLQFGSFHTITRDKWICMFILAALTAAGELARGYGGPRMAPDLYMERHGGGHVYMKPGVDSPQDIASRAFEAGLNAAEHGVGLGR